MRAPVSREVLRNVHNVTSLLHWLDLITMRNVSDLLDNEVMYARL